MSWQIILRIESFDSICNALIQGSWKEVLKWAFIAIHTIGCMQAILKEGLEMSLFCHFCNCCHGWWSWKELDLLHFRSFLPYVCCDWKLGSWKELVLVLSCSFWPVMDWGLERRSWEWLVFALSSSPGLRTAPVHWSCLPIYVFDLRQFISLDGFNARNSFGIAFAQYLY